MTGPIRPEIYDKTWVASLDDRTRPSHRRAHGQKVPFSKDFTVGGERLRYPGDPDGSPEETYNCRCHMIIAHHGSLTADAAPNGQEHTMTETTGTSYINTSSTSAMPTHTNITMARLMQEYKALHPDEAADAGKIKALLEKDHHDFSVAEDLSPDVAETYRTFTDQKFAVIGSPTDDNRMFASDIDLSFRSFPLPLMWCEQTGEGHENAYTIGVIEDARVEGENILVSGYLLNTEDADRWYSIAAHGVSNASADLIASEWGYTDDQGNELDEDQLYERFANDEPIVKTFRKAKFIGVTFVATPAFDTRLTINGERESRDVALVASAAAEFKPRIYDHRLFEDPKLSGPTLPTVGEDGRIYGHLALFNQCHRSIQTECVIVPRSPSGYSQFHTSPALRLDNGARLPVGRLTVGTGHADHRLSSGPALAHYDTAGTAFALVRVGEDSHGIWFSGVAAPWATPEQIEMGMSAPLSGDWRDFGSGLDLIAALAVNTPGFAARGRDDDQGRPVALVASLGPPSKTRRVSMTREEIKSVLAEALREDRERTVLDAQQQEQFSAERIAALDRARKYMVPFKDQIEAVLARLK